MLTTHDSQAILFPFCKNIKKKKKAGSSDADDEGSNGTPGMEEVTEDNSDLEDGNDNSNSNEDKFKVNEDEEDTMEYADPEVDRNALAAAQGIGTVYIVLCRLYSTDSRLVETWLYSPVTADSC